jgi:hypothetical protein
MLKDDKERLRLADELPVRHPSDESMIEKTPPPAAPVDLSAYGAARQVQATERVAKFRLIQNPDFPSTPPPDVLSGLDSAALVHEELHSRGLNVSFDVQPDGGVRVSVLDETGAVVRAFSPAQGLDVLSGELPLDDLDA